MSRSYVKTFLGPDILPYFDDDDTVEIYTNRNSLWIDSFSKGRLDTGIKIDDQTIIGVITAVAGEVNVTIENRLSANYEPLNCRFQGQFNKNITDHPSFTFRKRAKKLITLDMYLEQNRITQAQYDFLIEAMAERKNIVIAGGTSSGKTTFAQAILQEIAKRHPKDRIGLLEDTPEIKVQSNDFFDFHTSKGDHKNPPYTLDDALFDSLRMTPDRLVVGEVRDSAAYTVMDAWNTGHNGGILTIHANSPKLVLRRIHDLIRMRYEKGEFNSMIGDSVDIVVYMAKVGDISRKVHSIISVKGYDETQKKYITVNECVEG